ncbi:MULTISPECIES: tRNA lysidine(34) synthetase TilS [unclassified Phenylobacterium]|uniref:tRNA lysidine(34) synthetase TilS n=1 Tax=unclassified Phenylobacterium TaxID=2640670 RepID=UPI00083B4F9D|nr:MULTISPECIES: tRNA lysidine(34) synthetase TilS [unclassified Phenylobacterium]
MRGLEAQARRILDGHLLRDSRRPLAVGLSGGSDSLALTLIADAWARGAGRDLLILTVDHGLQADSAAWTQACAAVAARFDRPFRALCWTGDKPAAGLPAAARLARHRLLADAAREAGARVILLGHTADDLAEAAVMRAGGSTTPDPRAWAPSPVWPQGRGVFLLRPLLGAARADLRAWLAARGETWIDDPANADPRYARSRARLAMPPHPAPTTLQGPLELARFATEHAGIITLESARLGSASPDEARRFVALAAVCAGGGERLPATARTARAAEALLGPAPFTATLAGARIQSEDGSVRIFREPGEAGRGGLASLRSPGVFDGRFEIAGGAEVRRLSGLASRLSPPDRAILRELPAAARGALPVVVEPDGAVRLAPLESLVGERLRAAAGLVQREPA